MRNNNDLLFSPDLKAISKGLSSKQKEVINLLQQNEVLRVDNKKIVITCGDDTKTVSLPTFYNLVEKGLIFPKTVQPLDYVLSYTGETIKI